MARRLPAVPRMSETPRSTTEIKPPSAREDGGAPCSADALLAQLKSSTDLAWLVERVVRNDLPWVVVPAAALRALEERDPVGWAKVSAWLAAHDIGIVRI